MYVWLGVCRWLWSTTGDSCGIGWAFVGFLVVIPKCDRIPLGWIWGEILKYLVQVGGERCWSGFRNLQENEISDSDFQNPGLKKNLWGFLVQFPATWLFPQGLLEVIGAGTVLLEEILVNPTVKYIYMCISEGAMYSSAGCWHFCPAALSLRGWHL